MNKMDCFSNYKLNNNADDFLDSVVVVELLVIKSCFRDLRGRGNRKSSEADLENCLCVVAINTYNSLSVLNPKHVCSYLKGMTKPAHSFAHNYS